MKLRNEPTLKFLFLCVTMGSAYLSPFWVSTIHIRILDYSKKSNIRIFNRDLYSNSSFIRVFLGFVCRIFELFLYQSLNKLVVLLLDTQWSIRFKKFKFRASLKVRRVVCTQSESTRSDDLAYSWAVLCCFYFRSLWPVLCLPVV